ncbi:MAG: glycoside hydrolase family 3 N-terminal domain-containing protein [Syntrophobacteraceae bacterium]
MQTVIGDEVGIHLLVGFGGQTLDDELRSMIRTYRIGGLVLFRRNIDSPGQLKDLLESAQAFARETLGRPLWVSIDQEGGPVQRLGDPWPRLPAASDLSAEGENAVRHWATIAGAELRALGIQMNLAPVLDVLPAGASDHFMAARSLGDEPERVGRLGCVWIEALQKAGASATAKHFPGLGQARSDPHHFAPVIEWENGAAMERDLHPFRAAIASGVQGVMTSHALYPYWDPVWPATLSPVINREWLRDRLGFRGVLLSDDMDMAAMAAHFERDTIVTQGLRATVDFFLSCQEPENIAYLYAAITDAVRCRSDCAELHRMSVDRIRWLFETHRKGLSGLDRA